MPNNLSANIPLRRSSGLACTENKENKTSTSERARSHINVSSKSPIVEATIPVQHHSSSNTITTESIIEDVKMASDMTDCYASNPKQHPNRKSNILLTLERNKKKQLTESCFS